MALVDIQYNALIRRVLKEGALRPSRAGDTISVFGAGICVSMQEFPMITTRKLSPKGVLGELAAFIAGSDKLQTFKDFGCNYWDANAAAWSMNKGVPPKQHEVGRIYGVQWRSWNGWYDQLRALVYNIRSDPHGRRHILTTWHPSDLNQMCLPPCHLLAQFYVHHGRLSCLVYMRSVDLALGLPSDIILYATLLMLVAKETSLEPGTLQFSFGDTHVYANHEDQLREQITLPIHPGATAKLADDTSLFTFKPSDLEITDYASNGAIQYEFNV